MTKQRGKYRRVSVINNEYSQTSRKGFHLKKRGIYYRILNLISHLKENMRSLNITLKIYWDYNVRQTFKFSHYFRFLLACALSVKCSHNILWESRVMKNRHPHHQAEGKNNFFFTLPTLDVNINLNVNVNKLSHWRI